MPHQRAKDKTQTSISLHKKELAEMRAEIKRLGLRGVGELLEILWKENYKKSNNQKKE